jgi:hypothetical protein
VKSRIEPKTPLSGYEVFEVDNATKRSSLIARTDWRGQVSIAPAAAKPLRLLLIKNGADLLAHMPIVPGLDPQLTAEIANTDFRLQAEGYITGFQEEVVDLFLHREMLIRGIKAKIEAGDPETAQTLFEELGRLPAGKVYLNKLAEEKKKLVTKDQVVQNKIDKLFDDTKKVVEKCLDEKRLQELEQELRDAKRYVEKPEEGESAK